MNSRILKGGLMKKATIKNIASKAGVSVATVSRVINNRTNGVGEMTRKRINEIIAAEKFVPSAFARGLVVRKSKIIGVLIPDITSEFYTSIARGVEKHASSYWYNVILCDVQNNKDKESEYINFLIEHQVEGLIYAVLVDSKLEIPNT